MWIIAFQAADDARSVNLSKNQEPMSRSMEMQYIPVKAFSLFLDRITLEWDSRERTMTSDVTGPKLPSFLNREGTPKMDHCV